MNYPKRHQRAVFFIFWKSTPELFKDFDQNFHLLSLYMHIFKTALFISKRY